MKKTKRRKQPKPGQPGLFDVQGRAEQLTRMGDPLVALKAQIDWEAFRPELERVHDKARKSAAGAKPYDVVLMFKMLVLQQLHNLADEKVEYLATSARLSALSPLPSRSAVLPSEYAVDPFVITTHPQCNRDVRVRSVAPEPTMCAIESS